MPTLEWIGKNKVINHHQEVPYRVLDKKYTYNADNSENMIIHGDNLEALKSLLPKYEGRVKCIYIDPPYNTGKENWVYNDNVNDPRIKKWLGEVVGKEGEDLSRHDKWLCMMYPRLKLLQKLLADDGAIFISIDDNEQANLKLICDEIFGSQNFITNFIWQKKNGGGNDSRFVATEHEYIVTYTKNINLLKKWFLPYDEKYLKRYCEEDNDGSFFWDTFMRASGKQYYPITCPDGTVLQYDKSGNELSWLRSEARFIEDLSKGKIRIIKVNGVWTVHFKQYLSNGIKPRSILQKIANNSNAKQVILDIFQKQKVFDYSKPYQLIQYFISIITNKNSIILDSFAGSGTTAHAVLNMNKVDGGHRKFIMIEMMDYAENITAERVRRVIDGYGKDKNKVEGTGGNFSYYELGEPLLLDSKHINENIGIDKLREYIWFTETKTAFCEQKSDNKYYLGNCNNSAYYFYYEKNKLTTLNYNFLSTTVPKSENYVIYADICMLSKQELIDKNITFKKIPRDISRL